MDNLFLDTSAFLKLHISEKGSSWLTNFVIGKQIIISQLALFESATVLRKRYLDDTLTREEASKLYLRIHRQLPNYILILLGSTEQLNKVVSTSFNLPAPMRIRTLDAIQLVAAIIAYNNTKQQTPSSVLTVLSSDQQLLKVAQVQGFTTENPENYP